LVEIANDNDPLHPTKLMPLGDMFNFMQHVTLTGGEEDYEKIVWLGQHGAPSGGLGYLGGDLILALWDYQSAKNVRASQPPFPGLPNISVAPMISDADIDPALNWARNPTWYAPDAFGFTNYRNDSSLPVPTANETQFFDFAWKGYKNPDASLQVFQQDGTYLVN